MPELQASRRLVKSPPELWAEVSDAGSLARHLGELGEIRITRLEPETTVAWEGESASGTVELAPAGWGTSVTFTAAPIATDEPVAQEPAPEPPAAPEPQLEPEPVAEHAGARRSWFGRLFARKAVELPAAEPVPDPAPEPAPTPEPVAAQEPEQPTDPLETALTNALDSLGAAHHRPFSRG